MSHSGMTVTIKGGASSSTTHIAPWLFLDPRLCGEWAVHYLLILKMSPKWVSCFFWGGPSLVPEQHELVKKIYKLLPRATIYCLIPIFGAGLAESGAIINKRHAY